MENIQIEGYIDKNSLISIEKDVFGTNVEIHLCVRAIDYHRNLATPQQKIEFNAATKVRLILEEI